MICDVVKCYFEGPSPTNDWRLNITAHQNPANGQSIRQLEFFDTLSGGSDLTTGATQHTNPTGNNQPLFDDDFSWGGIDFDAWGAGTSSNPIQVGCTITSTALVERVKIYGYGNAGDSPTAFDVQHFDGSSYVTYWSIPDTGTWVADEAKTFYHQATSFPVDPSISSVGGTYANGVTLNGNAGTHTGASATYKWTRDGVDIVGATGLSYTLVSADIGHVIRFVVTAVNKLNSTPTATGTSLPTPTISA